MAVTINTEAPDVGLVKNKILYKLTTDNYLDNAGVAAVFRMEIVSVPSNGDSFVVSWDEGEVSIEGTYGTLAESVADTTGTIIRDDQVTKLGVSQVVALKLATNALISSLFTVVQETEAARYYVKFTAKQVGKKYNSDLFELDAIHTWETVTTGSDDDYDGRFYISTQVFIKNDIGEFDFVASQLDKPNLNQVAHIDVSEILKSTVDDYDLPEIGLAVELRQDKILKEYKLLFFEYKPSAYGSYQPVAQVNEKFAWFAGFSPEDFAQHPNPQMDFFASNQSPLSWFTSDREVREDQDHFFSFINYDTSSGGGGGT